MMSGLEGLNYERLGLFFLEQKEPKGDPCAGIQKHEEHEVIGHGFFPRLEKSRRVGRRFKLEEKYMKGTKRAGFPHKGWHS